MEQVNESSRPAPSNEDRTEIRGHGVFAVASPLERRPHTNHESVLDLVGQSLDHYQIESLVGVGGMGAVFRGRDVRLDRVVAVKVVPMAQRSADALRRFRMEAQSAAKLDHPNIARVYYVGETERWSYIVFEFIEGTNLRQLVLDKGPLSIDDATRFTCQVAEALQHAHERGVVHRDIKPSNILVGGDGRAKIVDMGLARTTELDRSTGDLTASGVTLGTFDYISPEQAHDPRDADVRSDIYSLGCTLYFLLTGQPPFPDGTALQKLLMHGTRMPEDPRCFRNDVSDALIAILRKMMAKKPRDRYQEPVDLVNDLRTLAVIDSLDWKDELPEDALHGTANSRSWWEFALPGLACAAIIGLVTMWLYNDNQRSAVYVIPRVSVTEVVLNDESPLIAEATPTPNTPNSEPIASTTLGESNKNNAAARPVSPPPNPENTIKGKTVVKTIVVGDANSDLSTLNDAFDAVRSFEEALTKWRSQESVERIVIAQPILSLPKSMVISGKDATRVLRIEGIANLRPMILINDTAGRSLESQAAGFVVESANVEWKDIDFDWSHRATDSSATSLITLASGTRLRMINSTITVRTSSSGKLPSVIRFRTSNPATTGSAGMEFDRSCVRGQCNLVHVTSLDRVEVLMNQCWAAIAGSMLEIEGAATLNRSPRIRCELSHVTSITLNPWLRIRMTTTNPYPIAFVRIANECVFSGSATLVEWDATNVSDWPFAAQAKKVEDLGRWIDLRGLDNVYDVPSISRLVQVIMSMSSEEVSIDSDSNLLKNERGIELLSAWKSAARIEPSTLPSQTPQATAWVQAGVAPGVSVSQLPPFPSATLP